MGPRKTVHTTYREVKARVLSRQGFTCPHWGRGQVGARAPEGLPERAYAMLCYAMLCYAKSLQSCPTLCDPIDGSPPGSPVPGILQARTLEQVAISFSNA